MSARMYVLAECVFRMRLTERSLAQDEAFFVREVKTDPLKDSDVTAGRFNARCLALTNASVRCTSRLDSIHSLYAYSLYNGS
jgi:hypothetical protein